MNENEILSYAAAVQPSGEEFLKAAAERQGALAKPPGSLGLLEEYSIRMAGVQKTIRPHTDHPGILVFAADNGVVEEGVSSAPKSVTWSQCVNMTRHLTGMSSMAHHFGDDVLVVDVGVDARFSPEQHAAGILDRKVRMGTRNLAKEAAMTREEVCAAMSAGIEAVGILKERGVDVIGIGEMGIGNTTTSSCVLAVLTGSDAETVTGRGGGLTDEAFVHKKQLIARALEMHFPGFPEQPVQDDVIGVLSKVGGLDISAMCGAFLACARAGIPAVVDGFISIVAAMCAVRLCPAAKDAVFLSHASYEIGYRIATEDLGVAPCLLCGMRLGEGSGCVVMFRVLEAACAAMNEMATFEEASINDDYLEEIRAKDSFTVES